jgi:subtilase family serine protease
MGVLAGSGGGVSALFSKPSWQAGRGVPADSFRDVPDVALNSASGHDAYLICSLGSCSDGFAPQVSKIDFVGGTSAAAPVFAGLVAILNQHTRSIQGNINPGLYALASLQTNVFHDVELGDNRVPCVAYSLDCGAGWLGYTAGPGYDLVTGLGSVDATELIQHWGADFQLVASPGSINLNGGESGTAAIDVNAYGSFTGTVSFACAVGSGLTNTTCSVPGTVSSNGSVMLTISNSRTASSFRGFWTNTTVRMTGFGVLLALSLATFSKDRRRLAVTGLGAICLVATISCGSGTTSISNSSPISSGDVTVTATSGVVHHSITVHVTLR